MDKKILKLSEIAALTKCELKGDPNLLIEDVSDLESAKPQHASFLSNDRYTQAMAKSQAGVIFIDRAAQIADGKNFLVSDNPSKAFQQLVDHFHPQQALTGFEGIHSTAVVHPSAKIGQDVSIGPHAVIDEGVQIGEKTFIGAGTYIGPNTAIGSDCIIHPRVVVRENCLIGNRVIIQPGAVIGSCGFGYITEQGRHHKLNQVGNVRIEDDVEIGANSTIDRARFQSTTIGQGTKIDNLVQIGHKVQVGPHNIIVAQTGIAGSTATGSYVVLGGHVAITGHIRLDDGVMVAAKSGVTKSISKGTYGGLPAMKIEEYNRNQVYLRNIEKYVKQIDALSKRLAALEEK